MPISDEAPAGDFPDPDADPVTLVARRLILPTEARDKSEETADDGKDLQVNLSSDVLFAVGKATLTPRATSLMARTAKLIDASPAMVVTVAGHAESSGNDAINDPLSLRRAQAVEHALSALLTAWTTTAHAQTSPASALAPRSSHQARPATSGT
ncbi:OmpA family protein [Micromonospora zamorensis]|uniref:OmpA family protein n=1 Tax=Micromonospora zamorensis TaxID=709883 RepID=UPI0037893996